MEENTESSHFPHQNRRTRLRFTPETTYQQQQQQQQQEQLPFILQTQQRPVFSQPFDHDHNHHQNNLSLSLSFQHQEQQDHVFLPVKQPCDHVEGRSSVPLGPFTGYATILKSSRFLSPAQGLLDDFCGGVYGKNGTLGADLDCFRDCGIKEFISCSDRFDLRLKNSKLLWLLEEVYRRYKVYCQQMQTVVASFRAVSGLGNAAPYIGLAFKAVMTSFSSLKNAILDHIICTSNEPSDQSSSDRSGPWRFGYCTTDARNPNMAFLQHQGWRSQRGLPDHAVAMLKSWLFQHFLHPYPSDSEKQMLAHQTGLSRTQVSNWFINARVRLWKPMVEEMHTLEKSRAAAAAANGAIEVDCKETQKRGRNNEDDSSGCNNVDYRFWGGADDHETAGDLGLSLYQRNGFHQTTPFHTSGNFDATNNNRHLGNLTSLEAQIKRHG